MATSGTYTAQSPDFAGFIDEGFERCGHDPAKLTHRHLTSAKTSMHLALRHLENSGYRGRAYSIDRQTQAIVSGDRAFQTPAGTLEVLDAIFTKSDGTTRPLARTDRFDHELLTQTSTGEPSLYFVSREIPAELSYLSDTETATWSPGGQTAALNYLDRPILVLWPTANVAGTLIYYRVRQIQDATLLSDDMDVSMTWHGALADTFSFYLSLKWAPERATAFRRQMELGIDLALGADPNYGDTMIYARYCNRRRRRF